MSESDIQLVYKSDELSEVFSIHEGMRKSIHEGMRKNVSFCLETRTNNVVTVHLTLCYLCKKPTGYV